jgi:hypothetical protein
LDPGVFADKALHDRANLIGRRQRRERFIDLCECFGMRATEVDVLLQYVHQRKNLVVEVLANLVELALYLRLFTPNLVASEELPSPNGKRHKADGYRPDQGRNRERM